MKDESINFDTDRVICPFWVKSRGTRCGVATHGDLWCPRHLPVMVRRARAEREKEATEVKVGSCLHYSDGLIVSLLACWGCQLGSCPGGWHTWADVDDVEHAAAKGDPDPSGLKCGCECADGPSREPEHSEGDESLDWESCPVCGSAGACAYDVEGRPLIHSDPWGDDE